MKKHELPRFWELDFLRGIAIVSMTLLHAVDDYSLLKEGRFSASVVRLYWQKATAILFLVISGMASVLRYWRNVRLGKEGFKSWGTRGLILLGWGMAITFITAVFLEKGAVVFGILHLLSVGSVLAYPLLPYKYSALGLGVLTILIGAQLARYRFEFPWLVWLGLIPERFLSIDYFPIFPWFGYLLIGIFGGHYFYPLGIPRFRLKENPDNSIIELFCFLGRRSLLIYLLHQPVLFGLLSILYGKIIK